MDRCAVTSSTLICCHHTIRNAGFEERVSAAAVAGYDGVGLNLAAYRDLRAGGRSDQELLDILDQYDQRILEVEALRGWSASGEAKERSDANAQTAFHLAETFGVPYLQAIGPYEGTLDEASSAFAALCDRAADHGMDVGLEFLPSISNIPDVTTAARIADGAARANGGVCVDSWHFTRGAYDWDALAAVPGELVKGVQLNDGPITPENPDYLDDCLSNRRVPGQGEFELVRLVETLDRAGSTAPISVEVISNELDELSTEEAAVVTAAATRDLLATART